MEPKDYQSEDTKKSRISPLKAGLEDTLKQTRDLIQHDPDIGLLAQQIAGNDSPENISRFVAAVEKKIEKFALDRPNWDGNQFFDDGHGNKFVKTDQYLQLDCVREAAHTGTIVMALKEEKMLPPDTSWQYIINERRNHWAPIIFRKGKEAQGFILDTWLVPTGAPAPTFASRDEWQKGVELVGDTDSKKLTTQREAFYQNLSGLQDPPIGDRIVDALLPVHRKFDHGFIFDWQKQRLRGGKLPDNVMFDGNVNLIGNHEAEQDLFTVKYYLGNPPEIQPAQMPTAYFESLRDRLAHILETDKTNATGITAKEILKTKNFEALKPLAEKFYAAYGVSGPNTFETQLTPEQLEKTIRTQADFNKNGTIEYGEARAIAEMLRKPFKDSPKTLAIFDKFPWQDPGVDGVVSQVKATIAPRKNKLPDH